MALLTTRQAAELLSMSEDWVREHAAELGGIRTSDGPRAPLRFEPRRIEAWEERQRLPKPKAAKQRRRPGPRPAPAGVELFPLPPKGLLAIEGTR